MIAASNFVVVLGRAAYRAVQPSVPCCLPHSSTTSAIAHLCHRGRPYVFATFAFDTLAVAAASLGALTAAALAYEVGGGSGW